MGLCIDTLYSGGVITTYHCTARCAHCLYAASPEREEDYMSQETAREVFAALKSAGVKSVHIGGGEPLLDPDGLYAVLKAAVFEKIRVEYVETNASWYVNDKKTKEVLKNLLHHNVHTLLISVDPFHNEYVPFSKVKRLIGVCEVSGMGVFSWQMKYYKSVAGMGKGRHTLEEYEAKYGQGFIKDVLAGYGLTVNGRALALLGKYFGKNKLETVLNASCRELQSTGHFHADLYQKYIPPGCAGLGIDLEDIGQPLEKDKYPLITLLYEQGTNGLLDFAVKKGFSAQDEYFNKCDLCLDIRKYLLENAPDDYPEITPEGFYHSL